MMFEKIFLLPEMQLMFHVKHYNSVDNLVVAGGRAPQMCWLKKIAADKIVYCADRGAKYCLAANILIKTLTGDGDSAERNIYQQAESQGTVIYRHPPAKDDTDLQLLLKNISSGDILASGVWGGRFDHLYSNVYSLLQYKKQHNCQVVLADEQETMILLNVDESVKVHINNSENIIAISLLPLTKQCKVNFSGVYWPLKDAQLQQLYPYSISNILEEGSSDCSCQCLEGCVGLYFKWK